MNKLIELKRDEKGVTALEYGLIAAMIAVVIIGAVSTLGGGLKDTFKNVSDQFKAGSTIQDASKTPGQTAK